MTMFFHGPKRWATYAYPDDRVGAFDMNLKDHEKCGMGDHKWPVKAFMSIIPNRFPLCSWHYVEMYSDLHDMLKRHYENEPGRDWF